MKLPRVVSSNLYLADLVRQLNEALGRIELTLGMTPATSELLPDSRNATFGGFVGSFQYAANAAGLQLYVGLEDAARNFRWQRVHISETEPMTLTLPDVAQTPANPTQSAEGRLYVNGGKLVCQYNDAATVRYRYMDLTGTNVAWTHTTTAP